VGGGWSLNAGGVITRSFKGGPDDCGLAGAATQWGHFRDYGYTSYLHEVGGPNCAAIPCPAGAPRHADDMAIMAATKDGEPDLYFFNFGKYQGKFYFHDDRSVVMVPRQDFKIEPILADETNGRAFIFMPGFKITDPDGTQYFFGQNQETDGNVDARDLTYNMNTHTTPTMQGVVSSWYLNKIVSPDGLFSIKLIYESDQFSTYTISKFPLMNVQSLEFGSAYGDYEYDLAKEYINGVRLKEIVWANGKLAFKESTTGREDLSDYLSMNMTDAANTTSGALDAIEIDNLSGYCKKFKFYTSYFRDLTSPMNGTYPISSINSDKHSLRLDSLQEMTCDNVNKLPVYRFSYNSGKVSRKISFGQDHWGFNNGVTNNATLIPTYWVKNVDYAGADREPDETAMKGGILEKITYPTGGFTQFDYEPHEAWGTIIAKSWSNLSSVSGGFGSSPVHVFSQPFNVTTGTVRIKLTNNNGGSVASVELVNSSNVSIVNMSTAIGTTKTEIYSVPNGTYTLKLDKETAGGNNGCGAEICQLITTTTLDNIIVGGLRIKTITTNDGISGNQRVKSYKYNYSGILQSSAYLFSRPVYVAVIRNDILKTIGYRESGITSLNGCVNADVSPTQPYFKSGQSVTPMTTTQGNHIGYMQVTVSETGNGFSVYQYWQPFVWKNIVGDVVTRNLDNTTCSLSAPNFPFAPVPFELKVGDLMYEGHFREDGYPLKETTYNPAYVSDTMTTLGYIVANAGISEAVKIWGTEYELRSGRKISLSTVTTEYDPVNGTSTTSSNDEYYESKFHNKPTRNVSSTSSATNLITLTKYALDYRIAACDNINSGYVSYQNAFNTVLSNYTSALNCSNTTCKWDAYQKYRWDRKVARENYLNYRKVNFTNSNNNFKQAHDNAKNVNALPELKPILQLQDDNNNAGIEVTKWRNTSLSNAMYIRYDFSTNPTTSVYPNKIQTIPLSTLSTSFSPSSSNGTTTITRDSRYIDENLYKYYQGNIVEITKKDGLIASFIYGLNNSVPIVKAVNVSHSTLLAAYNAAGGNLTTMRNQASLSGAMIATYTYTPIVGMTSAQNESKKNIFYEYDFFGRLKHLKDHDSNVLKVIDYKMQVPTNL
jgi:hypothetical protein